MKLKDRKGIKMPITTKKTLSSLVDHDYNYNFGQGREVYLEKYVKEFVEDVYSYARFMIKDSKELLKYIEARAGSRLL